MAYVITDACVDIKDKSCIQECPVDCIYEGDRQLFINPDDCIDCGACEPVCPTNAIYFQDDLPQTKKVFLEINRDFFKKEQ
jgi:NAD-dependent dihydropyrimidine dehydrogenase PreA subunit